jgi:hypothetical protein
MSTTYTINLFNSYFISYVKTFILLIAFYIIVITTIAIYPLYNRPYKLIKFHTYNPALFKS